MSLNAKNKKTIDAYYAHANSGDFSGALQYLSEDVIYRIPGPIGTVAYSGEWRGRDRVMMLFEAFNASFGIVDMTEIRSIATENDAVSMNDEIFTARGTGRPWRVGVAHHMRFNTEGLICELNNYTDIVPAIQALSGKTAQFGAMLRSDFLSGEKEVPSATARDIVEKYYSTFPKVNSLIDEHIVAQVPGDPRRVRFAGTWSGRLGFEEMGRQFSGALVVENSSVKQMIIENGSVAAIVEISGQVKANRSPFILKTLDFFQITSSNKIGGVTVFFDSYVITQGA